MVNKVRTQVGSPGCGCLQTQYYGGLTTAAPNPALVQAHNQAVVKSPVTKAAGPYQPPKTFKTGAHHSVNQTLLQGSASATDSSTTNTLPAAATDICNADTLVYRAAAASYRNLADTNLSVDQVTALLESSDGGYIAQYKAAAQLTGCCRENGQVFANAIVAAIDAVAEIGQITGSTGVAVLLPFTNGNTNSVSADPAVLGFYVINVLLNQYASYLKSQPDSRKATAEIFAQAFRDIFSNLVTTYGAIRSLDITYVSAVAHYLNLALGISPALPIIPFNVTGSQTNSTNIVPPEVLPQPVDDQSGGDQSGDQSTDDQSIPEDHVPPTDDQSNPDDDQGDDQD